MSYTGLDWLTDQARDGTALTPAATRELTTWLREDYRGIVRGEEMDAVVRHLGGRSHDHDLCLLLVIHWEKDRVDWLGQPSDE